MMEHFLTRTGKKVLTFSIAIILAITTLFVFTTSDAEAATSLSGMKYSGYQCTSNSYAASTINFLNQKYPAYSYYPYGGQCWGYAEHLSNEMTGARRTYYYRGRLLTKKSFLNMCKGIGAGAHLRIGRQPYFSGYRGHSVVLMSVNSKYVYWTDNNGRGDNRVRYYKQTIGQFVSMWASSGYRYINMVRKPVKYTAPSAPKVSAMKISSKTVRLCWKKATSTTHYVVYRRYSGGNYVNLGKASGHIYYDLTKKAGRTAYYKVRAVKKGTDKYSNVVSKR